MPVQFDLVRHMNLYMINIICFKFKTIFHPKEPSVLIRNHQHHVRGSACFYILKRFFVFKLKKF